MAASEVDRLAQRALAGGMERIARRPDLLPLRRVLEDATMRNGLSDCMRIVLAAEPSANGTSASTSVVTDPFPPRPLGVGGQQLRRLSPPQVELKASASNCAAEAPRREAARVAAAGR